MVGFPGESDADFRRTVEFVEQFGFSFVHVYGYTERPNTDALQLEKKIPGHVIEQRVSELIGTFVDRSSR